MPNLSNSRAKGWLIAAAIWLFILATLAVAYRFLIHPEQAHRLNSVTGSSSPYRQEISVGVDSFSGYALLRSDSFREDLKARGIRVRIVDDLGDVASRLESLRTGRLQMAGLTLDALLSLGAKAGFPAAIVLILDEPRGADAVVAKKSAVGSLADLDSPKARLVFTERSPSEFLARVVMAHFNLTRTGSDWATPLASPAEVLEALRVAAPGDRRAFVLWEPFVSQARAIPGTHVLLDSSQVRGQILDVLVARREFLRDQPDIVQAVVESHARALWDYNHRRDGLTGLVIADAQRAGTRISGAQAQQIVAGIQWKNVLENYAHFGLLPVAERSGLPVLEDLLGDITDVLVRTRAIATDPLPGQRQTLYYDRTLASLQTAHFHPGRAMSPTTGGGQKASPLEAVRSELEPASLTEDQWQHLRPVGELRTEPIGFGRASSNLTLDGQRATVDLIRTFRSYPRYYLRVIGHARPEGDPEANQSLALARSEAVLQALTAAGLDRRRLHAEWDLSTDNDGTAQAVSFVVGQVPY